VLGLDKKWIRKMVEKCFRQYSTEEELLTLTPEELEDIERKIIEMKAKEPNIDLYEIVNDVVYEYMTN
jgi:hypothetical protein